MHPNPSDGLPHTNLPFIQISDIGSSVRFQSVCLEIFLNKHGDFWFGK